MKPQPVEGRHSPLPSRPVAIGTMTGGGAAPLLVWLLGLFGVEVPPEVAAALGSVLGGVFGYITRGGRKS